MPCTGNNYLNVLSGCRLSRPFKSISIQREAVIFLMNLIFWVIIFPGLLKFIECLRQEEVVAYEKVLQSIGL